jgi:hypothetical protein
VFTVTAAVSTSVSTRISPTPDRLGFWSTVKEVGERMRSTAAVTVTFTP